MSTQAIEKQYQAFAQINTASGLVSKFKELERGRADLDREWRLNLEFYRGNQYAFNTRREPNRIQSLPTEDGDKPRFRIRLVSNQIMPGTAAMVAQLTKTKPAIWATPGTGSTASIRKAQAADDLFEYWWQQFSLHQKLLEAMTWGAIAGQGFWKITWDKNASTSMKFLMNPQTGQPIVQDDLQNAFRFQLEQMGIDPTQFEKTVYLGDIRVEVMGPDRVYLDPYVSVFEDAQFAICKHGMTPEEIKSRWGVTITPDAYPQDSSNVAMPYGISGASAQSAQGLSGTNASMRNVFIGYFLPNSANPKGRYVVWTEGPDQILEDKPWPYPFRMLPLVKFPGMMNPNSVYDEAIITQARPLQKELNRTISQIVEYKNLTIKPRVWAPIGSMTQRLTNEPGAVYTYRPVGGLRPEVETLPSMPPYVFNHLSEIQQRMDRLFNLSAVGRGEVPPNVEAGVAIDLLQETAVDMMVPTIDRMNLALCRAGKLMLFLGQEGYIEPRLGRIMGPGGAVRVREFKNSDIDPGVEFRAESGSGIPRTRAGREARIKNLMDMQILDPRQAVKHLDIADMKGLAALYQADEDQAAREHDKLLQGQPINPWAAQEVQEQIQQSAQTQFPPINPDTGQPFQSEAEIQEVIHNATVQPTTGENWDAHLDVHRQMLTSLEFESWPPEAQQTLIDHYNATLQIKIQMMSDGEPPKVSYQIKGTAGPHTSAKILQKAGIFTSPEEEAEEPLSTWVSDALDKPNAGGDGNEPITQEEQQQWAAAQAMHSSVAAAHEANAGKHDAVASVHRSTQEAANAVTALAKAREAQAKAHLAERKARAPLGGGKSG